MNENLALSKSSIKLKSKIEAPPSTSLNHDPLTLTSQPNTSSPVLSTLKSGHHPHSSPPQQTLIIAITGLHSSPTIQKSPAAANEHHQQPPSQPPNNKRINLRRLTPNELNFVHHPHTQPVLVRKPPAVRTSASAALKTPVLVPVKAGPEFADDLEDCQMAWEGERSEARRAEMRKREWRWAKVRRVYEFLKPLDGAEVEVVEGREQEEIGSEEEEGGEEMGSEGEGSGEEESVSDLLLRAWIAVEEANRVIEALGGEMIID